MQSSWIKRLFIVFVTIALAIGLSSINHTPATSATPTATASPPKTCVVGLYVTSLRDFNPAEKSFGANFWTWSICPTSDLKPLEKLEVINASESEASHNSQTKSQNLSGSFPSIKQVYWSQQEMKATLYHNWDTRNYPFDRHQLQIPLEEGVLPSSEFIHTPDFANSGYKPDMSIEGWKITNFNISQENVSYNTNFGNPEVATKQTYYSRLKVAIDINREDRISFFKLSAGVYAAVALSILALLLDEDFGDRLGIFVGTLFAVLVNMQVAAGELGSTGKITLIDWIHIIAIIYIFCSSALLIYTRFLTEQGKEKWVRYLMRRIICPILAASFIVLNAVIISYALIVG